MEEITVRELKQIPVERTSIAPADRTRHKLVRYKRGMRDKAIWKWMVISGVSLALNYAQMIIIYLLLPNAK